jgi:hypothetical protein
MSPSCSQNVGNAVSDVQRQSEYEAAKNLCDSLPPTGSKEDRGLFVAIDRATRYVYLELHDNKRMGTAAGFLLHVLQQYPFRLNKLLTDVGIEFSYKLLVEAKLPKYEVHPFVAGGDLCGVERCRWLRLRSHVGEGRPSSSGSGSSCRSNFTRPALSFCASLVIGQLRPPAPPEAAGAILIHGISNNDRKKIRARILNMVLIVSTSASRLTRA